MGSLATRRLIGWRTALKLGRVSNLPTVWTNVIAALALAGGAPSRVVLAAAAAMSLLYVAGMFLNDAFDRDIDARERGAADSVGRSLGERGVRIGFAAARRRRPAARAFNRRAPARRAGPCRRHRALRLAPQGQSLEPLVMGLCRALVYVGAAAALVTPFWVPVLLGAAALLVYVAGLTLAAKQERLDRVSQSLAAASARSTFASRLARTDCPSGSWCSRPALLLGVLPLRAVAALRRREAAMSVRAVGLLIAGIALVDALCRLDRRRNTGDESSASPLFALTLLLQRFIPGT